MSFSRTMLGFCFVIMIATAINYGQSSQRRVNQGNATAKKRLIGSFVQSKKAKDITITTSSILNESIESGGILLYVAPDKFHSKGEIKSRIKKETIEVAGKRYDFWNGQWIHSTTDYFPISEQVSALLFPKFTSSIGDVIKVRSSSVVLEGREMLDGNSHTVFSYSITYTEDIGSDRGKVWVNDKTNRVSKLETVGVLGVNESISTATYEYDKGISIDPPMNFITKKWFSDN